MNSAGKTTASLFVTLLLISAGIYIGYKHHKEQGFWWGVLALLLLGSYISMSTADGLKVRTGTPE